MDVGQSPVDAVVVPGESRVIDAKQVQHRGVQIVHGHRIAGRLIADLVAFAGSVGDVLARYGYAP